MGEKAMSITEIADRYGVSIRKFKTDMQNFDGLEDELEVAGFYFGSRILYPVHIVIIESYFGKMPTL